MGKRATQLRLKLTAPVSPEDSLHKTVADLLAIALLPPALWTTIAHGGYKLPKETAGRLQRYGLKPGIPDIMVLFDGKVIFIELKTLVGRSSKAQQTMHKLIEDAGSMVYVCRSPEAVIYTLWQNHVPIRESIVRDLLMKGDFKQPERQSTGEFYNGTADMVTEKGHASERPAISVENAGNAPIP